MIVELALLGGAYFGRKLYTMLKEQLAPPTEQSARGQQLQVMSPRALDISGREKQVDRYLAISTTALALAAAGALVSPILSVLSLIPALYATGPVWRDAHHALFKERRIRVAVLDAVVFVIAVGTRNYVALALGGWLYYLGRKLLIRTEDSSRMHLIHVFSHLPRNVCLRRDGAEVEVPLETVRIGDVFVVRAGETIAADGIITAGAATVDQHLLTGEAQPAERSTGDTVFASTTLLSGSIHVQVECAGNETVVAQIGAILNGTADFKTTMQSRGEAHADRMAPKFLALGAVALPILGPAGAGTVLTACFGYHMRILAPLGTLNFLTVMSRNGILVKDGRSLEMLHDVDTVVFDKTGTLTLDQPQVGRVHPCAGHDEDLVLRHAAAAELKQTHPFARAIVEAATARNLFILPSDEPRFELGYGIKARVDQRVVRVGSARFMAMEGIGIPDSTRRLQAESDLEGHALVYVAIDGELGGVIELQAALRPEAKRVVAELKRRKLKVVIISGDHEIPTSRLARDLSIDRYYAQTLPKDKAKLIEQLQAEGRVVCFVGDGINDAVALRQAQASISLRGASTVATDTAHIILMDKTLNQLCRVFDIAEDFHANMRVGTAVTTAPGVAGLAGAFFFHFGLVTQIILNNVGLAIGLGNAMRPVLKQPSTSPSPATSDEGIPDDDAASQQSISVHA